MSNYKYKEVQVGENVITVEELGRKSLKKAITAIADGIVKMNGIGDTMKAEDVLNMDISDMVDGVSDYIDETLLKMIPNLKEEHLEDIRNSEVAALFEAWVEVNFTGQKESLSFLQSLAKNKVIK